MQQQLPNSDPLHQFRDLRLAREESASGGQPSSIDMYNLPHGDSMSELFPDFLQNLLATEAIKEGTKSIIGPFMAYARKKLGQKWSEKGEADRLAHQLVDGVNEYEQRYKHRHGQLKPLGRSKPMPLESVYVAAQCLDPERLRAFRGLEDQENEFRQQINRELRTSREEPKNALVLANEHKFLMVLGAPGSGKSTFLRKIGLEAMQGKDSGYAHDCWPVLLNLREAAAVEKFDIERCIAAEFEICHFPYFEEGANQALADGHLLLLLDGLDEVPQQYLPGAVQAVRDFVDRFDKNHFVISCRTAAYRSFFNTFTDIVIADWDERQIQEFVQFWFGEKPQIAERLLDLLEGGEHQGTRELCTSPLLLTMICLEFERSIQLPDNRAVLYERALRIYLEEWDASKLISRAEVYKGLDTRAKEILLSEVALSSLQADRLFFPRLDLARQIEELMKDLRPEVRNVDGNAIIRAVEEQHGLLVERASDVYSFSHLTIQEYLAARAAVDHRILPSLVEKHLANFRWREVFLLSAGLLNPADPLLQSIDHEARKLIKHQGLRKLMLWCEQAPSGSAGRFANPSGRMFALTLALDRTLALNCEHPRPSARDIDRNLDSNLARNLNIASNLAFELARTLDLDRTLDLALDIDLVLDRALALASIGFFSESVCEALRTLVNQSVGIPVNYLNPIYASLINITDIPISGLEKEDYRALLEFLTAQKLLLDCRKAVVRVGHKFWESIVDQVLIFR